MVTATTWNRAICYPHVRSYIDIQSGDIFQIVRFDLQLGIGHVSAILVDAGEIYIADYGYNRVVVLQLAGSEA